MQAAGFQVEARNVSNDSLTAIKAASGVPGDLEACHTAQVEGYVVEGHVPADVVRRFLRERPRNVAGIAVAGMPAGSPGMEQGATREPYEVMTFTREGRTAVYARR